MSDIKEQRAENTLQRFLSLKSSEINDKKDVVILISQNIQETSNYRNFGRRPGKTIVTSTTEKM